MSVFKSDRQTNKQALDVRRCNYRDVAAAHGAAPGNYRAPRGCGRSPVKGSRAERPTPALNAGEEPVPHLIACNQFRDLHAFTSAPPPGLTSRLAIR